MLKSAGLSSTSSHESRTGSTRCAPHAPQLTQTLSAAAESLPVPTRRNQKRPAQGQGQHCRRPSGAQFGAMAFPRGLTRPFDSMRRPHAV